MEPEAMFRHSEVDLDLARQAQDAGSATKPRVWNEFKNKNPKTKS
jgi:hypothetical protein